MCSAQESETTYDTSFYSVDTDFILLSPEYNIGQRYTYEVINYNFRVKIGDTLNNTKKVSQFSFIVNSIDNDMIDLELILEEDYWKQIVMYDSIYSTWKMDDVPEVHLKYLYSENNFELKKHKSIGEYINKYIREAKTHIDSDTTADEWDRKIANTCLSNSIDSTVIRNWLTFSNGAFTLFTYYSFMFPENEIIKYELSQGLEDFNTSTYFVVSSQVFDNGNTKYIIAEDLEVAKNSSDRLFDEMAEKFSKFESTSNYKKYSSETKDETYLIVNPKGIIIETVSITSGMAVLKNGVSESSSSYSVRLLE